MRKMKNLEPRMEKCAALRIAEPAEKKGNWRSLKPDATALWVEVGCGKGKFTAETAEANINAGLAAARQIVLHKHITVNGQVVNIPSFSVKPGAVVGVRERSKSLEVIADALAGFNHSKYPWIEWDEATKSGKFLHVPAREDIPENIKEQLIVELYSK